MWYNGISACGGTNALACGRTSIPQTFWIVNRKNEQKIQPIFVQSAENFILDFVQFDDVVKTFFFS
jgi:hypothetical protein